ncbi:MAG: hypothetical protein HZC41_23180 [Chloroflexi bacterium]|nr:hypothetical protein [Chloroflexota bacterium]
MSDKQPDDLRAALELLLNEWQSRERDAQDKARNLMTIGAARSEYYRGMADAYRVVADELLTLLGGESEESTAPVETYAAVSKDLAQTVLKLAGLSAAELHAHKDDTFSIIFLPLQFRSVQEVESRLLEVADVVILDHGRLPDSNKSFVDFAFKTPPV